MPVLLQGGFGLNPLKFSEFICNQTKTCFFPFVCSAHMCSGVVRGFYGQNQPEIFDFFAQLNLKKKKNPRGDILIKLLSQPVKYFLS